MKRIIWGRLLSSFRDNRRGIHSTRTQTHSVHPSFHFGMNDFLLVISLIINVHNHCIVIVVNGLWMNVALSWGERGILYLIIPEGNQKILRYHPKGFARGMVPNDLFWFRRAIQDRIQSMTPDNGIIAVKSSPLIRAAFCPKKIDHTSRLTLYPGF